MPADPDDMLEVFGEIIRRDNAKFALEKKVGRSMDMTDEERRAQRISFVYGNIKLADPDNPYITKELVAAIGDDASKEEVDAIIEKIRKVEEAQTSLDLEPRSDS